MNRGKYDQDYCAAGEKRFQELDPEGFKPRGERNQFGEAYCHKCEQYTKVKNDGFFRRHKASIKGHVPANFKGSGTPERIRGRKQS